MTSVLKLEAGDQIFARSPNIFSQLIAWFTRGRREKPTLATHQIAVLNPVSVVHATWKDGVHEIDWGRLRLYYRKNNVEWSVLRRERDWTPAGIEIMTDALAEQLGWKYSGGEIILQAIDGSLAKILGHPECMGLDVVVMRKFGDLWEKGVICSKTANRPLIKVGEIPSLMQYADPDTTYDWLLKHGWSIVEHTEHWTRPWAKHYRKKR